VNDYTENPDLFLDTLASLGLTIKHESTKYRITRNINFHRLQTNQEDTVPPKLIPQDDDSDQDLSSQ